MGMYNLEIFVKEFGNRTIHNLNIIKDKKKADLAKNKRYDKVEKNNYEVTQLLNSLLGLLVIPFERYKNSKDKDLMKMEDTTHYNRIRHFIDKLRKSNRLYNDYPPNIDKYGEVCNFIRHLKNSLSHSGNQRIGFCPIRETDKDETIEEIIFSDMKKDDTDQRKKYHFYAKINIKTELEDLAQSIHGLYSQLEKEHMVSKNDYKKLVDEAEEYFKKAAQKDAL